MRLPIDVKALMLISIILVSGEPLEIFLLWMSLKIKCSLIFEFSWCTRPIGDRQEPQEEEEEEEEPRASICQLEAVAKDANDRFTAVGDRIEVILPTT